MKPLGKSFLFKGPICGEVLIINEETKGKKRENRRYLMFEIVEVLIEINRFYVAYGNNASMVIYIRNENLG